MSSSGPSTERGIMKRLSPRFKGGQGAGLRSCAYAEGVTDPQDSWVRSTRPCQHSWCVWAKPIRARIIKATVTHPFDQLKSGLGHCCSDADGSVVEDADWESKSGHYRVRVPKAPGSKEMIWVDVPDDAVVTEPNRAGRTMVWPSYLGERLGWIRCFMPGSMT